MASTSAEGGPHSGREIPSSSSYIPDGDPGRFGGGTYTNYATEPTIKDYENVFGPSARDIKDDLQKYKRHGRWHLPDALKGPNPWLADRIDGLITDATNSPFTSVILPYKFFENPDGKIKWNVWSFDEAMASRVPYESAARTLTQTKRSFAGYAVRHGLAINLEHNFMMSPKGRENFQNQLQQMIGSIQYSNDLDVHMALILAPSHEKHMREKYMQGDEKSPGQICREFVDLFGFVQKNQNALDIMIEESKYRLKLWGGPMPNFLLCNSKLTFQLTMTPERTNYITQGPDGLKRLKQGPEIGSYRGLNIIHTRAFSLENGRAPRDMLRRRVRVAEYYRIAPNKHNKDREFEFYNEARDTWFTLSFKDLLRYSLTGSSTNNDRIREAMLKELKDSGRGAPHEERPNQASRMQVNRLGVDATKGSNHAEVVRRFEAFNSGRTDLGLLESVYDNSEDVLYSPYKWCNEEGDAEYRCLSQLKGEKITLTGECPCLYTGKSTKTFGEEFYQVLARRCHSGSAVDTSQLKEGHNREYIYDFALGDAHFFNVPTNEPNNSLMIARINQDYGQYSPEYTPINTALIFSQRVADCIKDSGNEMSPDRVVKLVIDSCRKHFKSGISSLEFSVLVMGEVETELRGISTRPYSWCWCSKNPKGTAQDWQNPGNGVSKSELYSDGLLTIEAMRNLLRDEAMKTHCHATWLEKIQATIPADIDGQKLFDLIHRRFSNSFVRISTDRSERSGYTPKKLSLEYEILGKMSDEEKENYIGKKHYEDDSSFPDAYHDEPDEELVRGAYENDIKNVEIIIVRPNIEHWMLGIIMGLGGDQLGNTLWGQTELSVYDDSMHGIWGMSYKYHERAIVFNEKNLIRLWDVAYDGYNGGKDDTYVDWASERDRTSFNEDTMDVTKNYTGKSMMVMAFYHKDAVLDTLPRNWPSPIQFHDDRKNKTATLPVGYDNLHILDTNPFRVFDHNAYGINGKYKEYYDKMPHFHELHVMRKSAGDGVANSDTPTDSLAFQGSMRIKEGGKIVEEIHGSGHHGPDFTGAASVRAGKGYKIVSQPSLHRQI